jgi:hypothetical protein
MATQKTVTPALSIQPFTSSEPGAWSNSYLIGGESEANLFDLFMLRSMPCKLLTKLKGQGSRSGR